MLVAIYVLYLVVLLSIKFNRGARQVIERERSEGLELKLEGGHNTCKMTEMLSAPSHQFSGHQTPVVNAIHSWPGVTCC